MGLAGGRGGLAAFVERAESTMASLTRLEKSAIL